METFFAILAIIWSILCLILFFKVWGMTNDVNQIKKLLCSNFAKEQEASEQNEKVSGGEFAPDTLVVHTGTGRKMKIKSRLPNGKYICSYNSGTLKAEVEESEIVLYNEYKDKK